MTTALCALIVCLMVNIQAIAAPQRDLLKVNPAAHSDIHVRRFYGYAFDRKSGKYLYTAVHKRLVKQLSNGKRLWLGSTITYFSPNDIRIGEQTLNFSSNPYIPVYRLKLIRPPYLEGISKVTAKKVYMYKQKAGQATLKRAEIKHAHPMAADAGFDSFIRAHFAKLLSHKTLHVTYGVVGKLTSYQFQIHRISDTRIQGHKAVRFKIELASLLHFFTGALVVAYNPRNRHLLQYDGLSNLYNPKTGDPYHVRIDYYLKKPAKAPTVLPPLKSKSKEMSSIDGRARIIKKDNA